MPPWKRRRRDLACRNRMVKRRASWDVALPEGDRGSDEEICRAVRTGRS